MKYRTLPVIQDVSDIMHAQKKLLYHADDLKGLDRMKSMFIATTSRELLTPLNSILVLTSGLLEGWAGELNPKHKEELGMVYGSAKHLLALITDIIDISSIEVGKTDAHVSDFTLRQVVDEAILAFAPEIKAKGLDVSADTGDITMKSDRKRLLRCIMNLLDNAIKFTQKGGIKITARIIVREVNISITDTGVGIKTEDIDKIFEPFVRVESPLAANTPGTGLGLYLTKKLTKEVLGGDVELKSEYGKGSTFTLHMPVELEARSKNRY